MNPEQFILMMNDLPDAVIDSANSPVVKQNHNIWYMIPAVAACFIALIAAAVYPKLRSQTPEITEPPAEIITTETTTQNTAETTAMTVYATYTTAVSQDATHQTKEESVSQIVTKTVTATPVTQSSVPVQTVSVVQNETKPITETVWQTEIEPNTDTTDQTVTEQPIGSTINPYESRATQAEPIIEQSISVPVLRSEPVFANANQEAQEVTCKFHEATEEDLRTWGNEAIRFDRSAYKLICATISGYCQDAVITRGTIMNDDCQLQIAYLKESDVADSIQVKYLLAFPIEFEIQTDNLHAYISHVLGENFFQTLIEEYSKSITIQY